jgi:hypothetical protein
VQDDQGPNALAFAFMYFDDCDGEHGWISLIGKQFIPCCLSNDVAHLRYIDNA